MNKVKGKTVEQPLEKILISKDEQPYEVPENWVWTRLVPYAAECLDRYRKPVNAGERTDRQGEIPYYGATGQVGWIDDFLTDDELVLVGEDGAPFLDPYKNKAYLIRGKAWVNNHAHILKSNFGSAGNTYILNYLNVFNYNGYVSGSTRLKLTQKQLANIPIPVPPINEQKRIADQVERLFSKLNQAKQWVEEVEKTAELHRIAVLDRAFRGQLTTKWRQEFHSERASDLKTTEFETDIEWNVIDEIPQEWKYSALGNVCSKITDGTHDTPKQVEVGVPYITAQHIRNGKIDFDNCSYVSEEDHEIIYSRCNPEKGDVLYVNIGAGTATAAMNEADYPFSMKNVALLKPAKGILDGEYLEYYLQYIRPFVFTKITAGGSQPFLSLKRIKTIPILLPTYPEQLEIVKTINKLFSKLSRLNDSLKSFNLQAEELSRSILYKSFRGELGSNNPSEESSLMFLKSKLDGIQ